MVMKIGRLGRVKPSPDEDVVPPPTAGHAFIVPEEVDGGRTETSESTPPARKGVFITPRLSPEIVDAELRAFLDLPAVAA